MKMRIVLLGLVFWSVNTVAQQSPVIHKGELDLSGWNRNVDPVISLNGEWKFYWQQLVEARNIESIQNYSFAQLSIPWNEQTINGKTLPKNGYATYALSIKLPPNTTSVAFAVPAVFNSYAFWVEDKLICSSGKVATNAKEMIPQWRPQTVRVEVSSSTILVLFQIANFQETRGGCAEVMRIGDTEYLTWLSDTYHLSGYILVTFFLLVSLGGVVVYYINGIPSFLNLALLCLAFVVRFLFSDLYLAQELGVIFPWLVAAKIEYITIPLIVITATMFMSGIYPKEFKATVANLTIALCILLMVVVILVPSHLLSPVLVILQITGLLFTLYVLYVIIRALLIHRSGAWVSALSMGTFAMVGFYNIYAFILVLDLNRTVIDIGYAIALILSVISLLYRTPLRLQSEEHNMLRYDDLFHNGKENAQKR
ncbi:MAG TPA: 7TM-DISM domain-containing protein [Ohtaekwangia sp.]